jgi:hypothetical protein
MDKDEKASAANCGVRLLRLRAEQARRRSLG